jgi:hypothetical protein
MPKVVMGAFFLIAAAQVGGKAKGLVRLWMRVNGKDVDNSNAEQIILDPSFTSVLVSQGVAELKRGDKVTVVFSGSEPGVGLVVKKPAGEPVVPSVIFSGWRYRSMHFDQGALGWRPLGRREAFFCQERRMFGVRNHSKKPTVDARLAHRRL